MNHSLLLSPKFTNLLQSYLEGKAQQVKNSELSSAVSYDIGVPQGVILRPLLLLLVVVVVLTSSFKIQMYAFDTVIYSCNSQQPLRQYL